MRQWNVDELDSDLRRLHVLMDVICELQFERDPNDPLDPRLDDLLWVAREMTGGVVAHLNHLSEKRMARFKAGAA